MIDSALNIFPQTMSRMSRLINYEAVYRTAPATPGLLNRDDRRQLAVHELLVRSFDQKTNLTGFTIEIHIITFNSYIHKKY